MRRLALHTSESLKAQRQEPSEPLQRMASGDPPPGLPSVAEGDDIRPKLLGDLGHALAMGRPDPLADISPDGLAAGTHRSVRSGPPGGGKGREEGAPSLLAEGADMKTWRDDDMAANTLCSLSDSGGCAPCPA